MGYFEMVGDDQPNVGEIHLDPIDKQEVYDEYILDLAQCQLAHTILGIDEFLYIWRNCCGFVKIRKYKVYYIGISVFLR